VTVKVLIDEEGKVISADVLSGDPGARKAAVDAALRETFSPRRLSGRAVKTMGVITYNFTERGAVTKESESH
jgi:outer membrane biosynthesis protein TonB